jgi:hypothetical protein
MFYFFTVYLYKNSWFQSLLKFETERNIISKLYKTQHIGYILKTCSINLDFYTPTSDLQLKIQLKFFTYKPTIANNALIMEFSKFISFNLTAGSDSAVSSIIIYTFIYDNYYYYLFLSHTMVLLLLTLLLINVFLSVWVGMKLI